MQINKRENAVRDETVPQSAVQNGNCVRNGNLKTPREKRKVREQCENIRRNSAGSRRVSQLQNGEVVEAVTLFEVVSIGKQAMQSVVDDWVEAYKQDRNVALLDLINFFIQCSGCQGMVTAEMFQSLHKKDVMRKMTETFDEQCFLLKFSPVLVGNVSEIDFGKKWEWQQEKNLQIHEQQKEAQSKHESTAKGEEQEGRSGKLKLISLTLIPGKVKKQLILEVMSKYMKDKKVIKNRQHGFAKGKLCLTDIIVSYNKVSSLVDEEECTYGVYLDIRNRVAVQEIHGLSLDSDSYLACGHAMKLLTAVVNVHLNLDVNKHNAQRLYEVEKRRISGKRTHYRLHQLERKRKEYEHKLLEIQNMMNAIFKGTFLNRYRDVIPEIRATCIEEIGNWIKTYPDAFLNDSYLKYVGWMLYDKQAEVRLKCLLGLQGIYSRKELVSRMDLFTSRFKDRIVSMPLDKDHEVAVQAMKLLMLMSQ
ncbi:hypothetical protein WISP_121233 [Willisornis vidua]|uniref:SCD domain-containing protein n=1 Tax=Willisornis vidua TaxID=1566151 RepID=A0ABQ9CSH6_9PASS|nr:hypothetical protein WISP_121233 [Willisornis vidua]